MPRWLLYSKDVTPAAKLVYLTVQSHIDDAGTAYPSQRRIADESGLSLASVKRALRDLIDLGVVTSTARRRRDGGRTSSIYRVSTTRPQAGDNTTP